MKNLQGIEMEQIIRNKVEQALSPKVLEILNESHMHAGPAANSHFKVTVVSDVFEGKRPVARHQMIYKILADELAGEVHALALHVFTEGEWQKSGGSVEASPNCQGGH
jgi:BolA protein